MPLKPRFLRFVLTPLLGLAALLGACATRQAGPEQQGQAGQLGQPGQPEAAPAIPEPAAPMLTLDDYKREVARSISRGSAAHLYEGSPPALLKSVVVLSIAIDAQGRLQRVAVLRSNGFRALEQLALQSVKAAALPRPGAFATRRGLAEFTETWLFRDDNRFQIRSLALAQADG